MTDTINDRYDKDLTKSKEEKERYTHLNEEFQRTARRSKS